jgi:hypothetical protein
VRGLGSGGFAGLWDFDLLGALVVEVDVDDSRAAVVPDVFGDGEPEEDHALGGFSGVDPGFAQERFGGKWLEFGEGGVDVFEVLFFDRAGGEFFAGGSGEGCREVFEVERKAEPVIDTERCEDVEVVFGVLVGDDDGLGFEDDVGGNDDGAGDGQLWGSVGVEADNQSENDAENQECQENGHQEIALRGLGEFEVRHWQ